MVWHDRLSDTCEGVTEAGAHEWRVNATFYAYLILDILSEYRLEWSLVQARAYLADQLLALGVVP